MKLKSVLLAGLLSTAGVLTLSAADVYSVNAVGFVNVTVPAGKFAIIANPLNNASGNTLPSLLPSAPSGIVVYKFDTANQSFWSYTRGSRGWSDTAPSGGHFDQALFNPGEGFFVFNSTAGDVTLTFVGEVPQSTVAPLNITIPSGFSMLAPQIPQSDTLQTGLGLPAANSDVVYFFRNNAYQTYTKGSRGWSATAGAPAGEPTPAVGEGFFYFNAATQKTWSRSFTAN